MELAHGQKICKVYFASSVLETNLFENYEKVTEYGDGI